MRNLLDNLLVKLFNIHPVKATDVFTPTTSAETNYVKRPLLESIITKTLLTPGKQLLLFGHSGSGKTTLIRRVLKNNGINSIKTHCEAASTFNDILYAAFDSLNKYVVEEKSSSSTQTIKGSLAAEYKQISTEISKEICEENGTKMVRLLPPQLTPQKLAQFFGEGNLVWIIEDFHKVDDSEKKRIADLLKIFVDNSNDYKVSKVVCIGACENATDLVMLEPDLKTRVDEVKVHMLSEEEIRTLISNGCTLLNLDMESDLLDKISYYSSHIASTAHQMCLDICLSKGIDKRQWNKGHLEDIDFNTAVKGYVKANEGTFSNAYDVAVRNELGWYVLKTFSRNSQSKLSFFEIKRIVNQSKKHFTDDEIREKLTELCTYGLGVLFYSSSSDKYMLASPYWQSFLRIQFAQEAAEKQNAKKKRNLKLVDQNSRDAYVDRLMLELLRRYKDPT